MNWPRLVHWLAKNTVLFNCHFYHSEYSLFGVLIAEKTIKLEEQVAVARKKLEDELESNKIKQQKLDDLEANYRAENTVLINIRAEIENVRHEVSECA